MADPQLDQFCVNTIRFLSVDTVQKANSGHPGAPMGAATMAYVLWDRFLKHNPEDPNWPDRDRFILSPGHASALLYSLLHLTGYDLPLEELKQFRQWGSKTPGHPEYRLTPGVEMTTGPLGQGFAGGVGMAIAEQWQAEHYNQPGHKIIDHHTYAIVSDGDLQEGVASEAASLAGTLRLGKLIYLYDDNDISIEGDTDISFTEDVAQRFQAYGWHVVGPINGMDAEAVDSAIRSAKEETARPSLIVCRTVIGYGSPNKAGTGSAHGEPLGQDEIRLTRENLGWPHEEPFTIPEEAKTYFRKAKERGRGYQQDWQTRMDAYRRDCPTESAQLEAAWNDVLPEGWDQVLEGMFNGADGQIATRNASAQVMNAIVSTVHTLIGGSADLAPSTRTILNDKGHFSAEERSGHNMHFGVREHAMGSIANGMALHGGAIPYTATFLIFSDYMRPAIRLAALMELRVVYVFSHDSIGLGEDGPTHQPIEQLASLRTTPNMSTWRPADTVESAVAWKAALERKDGPTAMVFSRQGLPHQQRDAEQLANVAKGGYILSDSEGTPELILIATGGEVGLAQDAAAKLREQGKAVRVVSMPSTDVFDAQSAEYKQQVLPLEVTNRIAIEASIADYWYKYVGLDGRIVGMTTFGESAPAGELFKEFGFTVDNILEVADELLDA
ncbi:MAG TPA: transketolase [Marinobacter hydrocarbonoclasticus]|uniref:Transketolase n=1 Tax=Marinobacter nauticus TaxID=2743 RepID=A0A3B8WC81_MARNT|nr:transketolase [Marinobacter nauticus]